MSKDDYEQVLSPIIDEARREGRRLLFLYQFGPEIDGFTAGGAWENAKLGLQSTKMVEGCAVVSDARWVRESGLCAFLMPCPVRDHHSEDQADRPCRGRLSKWTKFCHIRPRSSEGKRGSFVATLCPPT